MPGAATPILGLTVPTVGGDQNSWGTELNADLAILDGLGAAMVINQAASFTAVPFPFPEILYRVTTGASVIVASLPAAATCAGKIFTFKKVDAGTGQIAVTGTANSIDGQTTYIRSTQFSYVRIMSNGASFDVIGEN